MQTLPQFALKNAHKILSPFLKALPIIGESAFGVYERLEELSLEYFSEHDLLQKNDKERTEEFIQKVYEDEGSIFEDNFYSQLIRQLIQQLKDQGKQTVLIIDDTDRMDPEHIFRILNVFAAHFDAPEYRKGDSNKFGFDKIIIVCDYNNLHKIFCHKYGATTDFAGYIDKFFSKQIYRYDNVKAVKESIYSIVPENNKRYLPNFELILSDMIRMNIISLREVLKIKKNNPVTNVENFNKELYQRNILYSTLSTIHLLAKLFGTNILAEKITFNRNKITEFENLQSKQPAYHYSSLEIIKDIILIDNYNKIDQPLKHQFQLQNKNYEIEIKRKFRDYEIDSIKFNGINYEELLSAQDFYESVLIAINKYEKMMAEK